jgi:hypothetical protein
MRPGEIFQRLSAMGAAAQASVPGLYAWGVTVAPVAWSRGASVVSKIAAVAALTALAVGVATERRWGLRARIPALWAFVLCCALAWSAAPGALAPLRIDAPRGAAGMLGWALFALASAAPALQARRADGHVLLDEPELAPRRGLRRGDALYLAGSAVAAILLQLSGWRVTSPERALLVRLVALAAGLALIGAAVDVALARHAPRVTRSSQRRLRRGLATFVVLAVLGLTGALFVVRG